MKYKVPAYVPPVFVITGSDNTLYLHATYPCTFADDACFTYKSRGYKLGDLLSYEEDINLANTEELSDAIKRFRHIAGAGNTLLIRDYYRYEGVFTGFHDEEPMIDYPSALAKFNNDIEIIKVHD